MEAALALSPQEIIKQTVLPQNYRPDLTTVAANFERLHEYLLNKRDIAWAKEEVKESKVWAVQAPDNPFNPGHRKRDSGLGTSDLLNAGYNSCRGTNCERQSFGEKLASSECDWLSSSVTKISGNIEGLSICLTRNHEESYSHWSRHLQEHNAFSLSVQTAGGANYIYSSIETPGVRVLFESLLKDVRTPLQIH